PTPPPPPRRRRRPPPRAARARPPPPHACAAPPPRPREWYVRHNRRLKAMRLAIALLDAGAHGPGFVHDRTIRAAAVRLGIHPPSTATCRMVRQLMHYPR
ncbi:hypothetical protein ACFV5M_28965, partial [Streptomyces albidoflavus]